MAIDRYENILDSISGEWFIVSTDKFWNLKNIYNLNSNSGAYFKNSKFLRTNYPNLHLIHVEIYYLKKKKSPRQIKNFFS